MELIERLKPVQACAIFLLGACSIDGAWPEERSNRGYFWDVVTHCRDDDSIDLFSAGLHIQPLTLRRWNVTMTTFLFDTNPKGYLRIDFADAKIEIANDTRMTFSWSKGTKSSMIPMSTEKFTSSKQVEYVRYSAEIEAHGEKLINLIHGREITATIGPYDIGVSFTMKDRRFEERLDELSICDSEINQVCCGACDQMTRANATVVCPSKMWYNYADEPNRRWKTVARIECRRGSWVAEWSGGTLKADATLEFQCAAGEPGCSLIIGCSMGGAALLLLVGIAITLFFLVRACKRGRAVKGTEKGRRKVGNGEKVDEFDSTV
ncbi:hypothetical protein PRIPAC_92025 [Pristionchus pacificus]|uniref:Uncharacterized protein n=1 Tax=Pristionchus pacificus TaxID=54126 RepID=A0A2A6BR60_PRIPA|nr:hypothetical protein PRIPAC_92025 [Pristionchus pacificus]|eukprot:PDM68409.1 hypothetical protein PRIPAC_46453 [Pristionchus pacificus]